MVFDGRPSTGCLNCRKRHIKCDETRPSCHHCTRTKRECPGYADVFFRDQTRNVVLRVKRVENRRRREAVFQDSDTADSSSLASTDEKAVVPGNLSFPWQEFAINSFMVNFVMPERPLLFSPSHLQYLPQLYRKCSANSPLAFTTAAICCAAAGNFSGGPRADLLQNARENYSLSLRTVNEALKDPVQARKVETLFSVMLFGVIESLLASSIEQWKTHQHIDGCVAILRLRGKDIVTDAMTATFFLSIRTMTIQDRRRRSKPLEAIFDDELTSFSRNLVSKQQTVNNLLSEYMVLIPGIRKNLLASLHQHTPSSSRAISLILQECQNLDSAFSSWPVSTPSEWKYRSVIPETSPSSDDQGSELYPNLPVDIYCDAWSACAWNNYRCTRLFLNAFIVRCVKYLTQDQCRTGMLEAVHDKAVTRIQDMTDEICSSIPFHIGYFPPEPLKVRNVPRMAPVEPIALGAYFLLWPIFVARSALTVSQQQRDWLRGRMLEISKRFGSHQAVELVRIGDTYPGRPLFANGWDVSYFENLFESCNLYAAGGV